MVTEVFFKNTSSLCPICREEIKAQLFQKEGGIMIAKECRLHGQFSALVDPDADLYRQAISHRQKRGEIPFATVIPVTQRCNLKCRWCYLPERGSEPEIAAIKKIIERCQSKFIVFSGGEPTLSTDLFELIRYLKAKYSAKSAVLLTNGLKLADADYCRELKKAGLDYLVFSFNGFRPQTHQYFNHQDLLPLKLKALENIKRLKIWTILSMTLAKNVNEDELSTVYQFSLNNLDFVRQIRLRNVSEIGIYQKGKLLYLSDLIKIVSQASGISLAEMSKNNANFNRFNKTANYFVLNIKMPYSKQNTSVVEKVNFRLEIFFWPTLLNIDLRQCRLFNIDHLTNTGEILPFWEALYQNEKKFVG
ncbi:MAG: radical SAM protein [Elusimicrobiota bacterium]